NGVRVLCALVSVRLIYQSPCGWTVRSDMKLHLSVPTSLILLGIILLFGCATGTLWPVHSFLLNFSTGFIETLFAILISASFVWGACTLYVLVVRLLGASGQHH